MADPIMQPAIKSYASVSSSVEKASRKLLARIAGRGR